MVPFLIAGHIYSIQSHARNMRTRATIVLSSSLIEALRFVVFIYYQSRESIV